MSDQDLMNLLKVAPGDFVTLDHEQAKAVREVMARRIPITVELDEPDHGRHNTAFRTGFNQDSR